MFVFKFVSYFFYFTLSFIIFVLLAFIRLLNVQKVYKILNDIQHFFFLDVADNWETTKANGQRLKFEMQKLL